MASRRGFLKTALGPVWTGGAILDQALLRAVRARAQAATPVSVPRLFDIRKVAEGVYAAIARPAALTNCNAVIFENAADLLVVDAHSKPSAVTSLVRQLRDEVTTKPVRYVVATHFHWDHSHGTPAYRRFAPHADIVSSEVTRRLMNEQTVPRLQASFEQMRKSLDEYKGKAAAAKTAEEKAAYETLRRETIEYLGEMKNFAPELPNVTLTDELILRDKAHDLHLSFRGRGHTPGDVIVYCPQKKVIATGDLLHASSPFLGDGYPLEWPQTLRKIAGLEFDQFAAGHGAVQQGKTRLHNMANYIEELAEAVGKGKRDGKSAETLQREITPARLKSLMADGYGEAVANTLLTYRFVPPPKPSAAQMLADAVKVNVGHTYEGVSRA